MFLFANIRIFIDVNKRLHILITFFTKVNKKTTKDLKIKGCKALTTILTEGWDAIEVVRCQDLHPEADNSVVVNLKATVDGQKLLKSQSIMKKSKKGKR